jgi:HAD superfamily hydrolase (TIGR01484 family)
MAPEPDWRPRLIAVDIDGTLCPDGTRLDGPDAGTAISEPVRAAVTAAVDGGAHVVLCSGRTMVGVAPFLATLGLREGYAICSNGSVLLDAADGAVLRVRDFDPSPAALVLRELLPDAVFVAEVLGVGNRSTQAADLTNFFGQGEVVEFAELVADRTPRMSVLWPGHSQPELAAAVAGVELPGIHYSLDHTEPCLMASPAGVTKGSALEELRAELGVPAGATMAVGDGFNDVEMLVWAGHGVAMGQAPAAVAAVADEVTEPVGRDGLAVALRRWFR